MTRDKKLTNRLMAMSIIGLLAVAIALLMATGSKPTPGCNQKIYDATNQFFTAVKNQDDNALGLSTQSSHDFWQRLCHTAYLAPGEDPAIRQEYQDSMADKLKDFTYTLDSKVSYTHLGKCARVAVKIESYDMGSAIKNAKKDGLITVLPLAYDLDKYSSRELRDSLNTIITSTRNKITKTVNISLIKSDFGWLVDTSDIHNEIYDGLNGGLTSYLEKNGQAPL